MLRVVQWLKDGLRPRTRWNMTPIAGPASPNVTVPILIGTGDEYVRAAAAGDFADLCLPFLYVGDRILDYGVSAQAATLAAPTMLCQLVRWKWTSSAQAEVLSSFTHTTLRPSFQRADATVQGVPGMTPVLVEAGYTYRVRVTFAATNDELLGGFYDTDHPKAG